MVNCSFNNFTSEDDEKSQAFLDNIIFKIPLLTKSTSWKNLHELNELSYKSAFTQVKTSSYNKCKIDKNNNTSSSMNQENQYPERQNSMSNPSFKSTPKSVPIEHSDNSPTSNSSLRLDQTCYFSPITPSDYFSSNSINNNSLKEKMVDITNFSPSIKSQDVKIKEPQSHDCKRTKRAHSLVNPGSIRQFQLLNRRGSKIYGCSKEFLDHLDHQQFLGEGKFATSGHHSIISAETRPIDLSPVIKNKSLKVLDQTRKNNDDDIFTVLGVLTNVLLINIRYWTVFFVTLYCFIIFSCMKFVRMCFLSILNIWKFFAFLPFKLMKSVTKKCFQIADDVLKLHLKSTSYKPSIELEEN